MDETILAYKDFVIKRSDTDILRGPCYLNDQIIGFYFQHLCCSFESPDILLVPPSLSFWFTNCDNIDDVKTCAKDMKFCSRQLILFPVNDNDYLCEGDSGSHWSLLVYHRSMNDFVHHDSMQGVNNQHAEKLYERVKQFVGPPNSSASSKLSNSSGRDKKNTKKKNSVQQEAKKSTASLTDALPGFKESPTPQQTNGYDCGLYVLAIARVICQWHINNSKKKAINWFCSLEKNVSCAVVELNMRTEILELIEKLRDEERD